jgi:hypothetical protein
MDARASVGCARFGFWVWRRTPVEDRRERPDSRRARAALKGLPEAGIWFIWS